MFFRAMLAEEHLSTDTKDVVKLGVALIATMAALVLSLLIASAKNTYDTRSNQLLQVSADIILLDAFWRITQRRRGMRGLRFSAQWSPRWSNSGLPTGTGPRRSIEEHRRLNLYMTKSSNSRRRARLSAHCRTKP